MVQPSGAGAHSHDISMRTRLLKLLPTLASVVVGILPVFVMIQYFGVSRKLVIGWGVLSYVMGVTAFKMPLYHLFVVKVLHGKLSHRWLSVVQGLISAISELGAAWLFFFFVLPDLSLAQLIGFGVSAGAVEAIMLPFIQNPLKGTPVGEHASEMMDKSSSSKVIPWLAVIERILAFVPHVAARGLVYVTFASGNPAPALLGLLTFASIDGRAYYAHLEKWPFDQVRVLGRLYANLAIIAVIQLVCFMGFYHLLK